MADLTIIESIIIPGIILGNIPADFVKNRLESRGFGILGRIFYVTLIVPGIIISTTLSLIYVVAYGIYILPKRSMYVCKYIIYG